MGLKQAYDYMRKHDILERDIVSYANVSFDLEDLIQEMVLDLKLEGDTKVRIYFDDEYDLIPIDYYLFSDIDLLRQEGKSEEEINDNLFFVDTKLSHALNIFKYVNDIF